MTVAEVDRLLHEANRHANIHVCVGPSRDQMKLACSMTVYQAGYFDFSLDELPLVANNPKEYAAKRLDTSTEALDKWFAAIRYDGQQCTAQTKAKRRCGNYVVWGMGAKGLEYQDFDPSAPILCRVHQKIAGRM
ncbi:hypothetical protein CLG85_025290 [Yangia mangrovi]|uniref:Uncharacterized protein n=2 Tax=Alloyangia mangrovi TaxID=1779329 RepID=A0A2A3K2H0_9RHOB|nr:hypothetical protein [Alloyangia mangrovi]